MHLGERKTRGVSAAGSDATSPSASTHAAKTVRGTNGTQSSIQSFTSSVIDTNKISVAVDDEHTGSGKKVNDYILGQVLGRGAFAYVCKATHEGDIKKRNSSRMYAIKVMSKQKLKRARNFNRVGRKMVVTTALDNAKREIAVMKKIEHPHLVKLYEVINDDMHDELYLVMEHIPYGQIMSWNEEKRAYFERLGETRAREVTRDVLNGLAYLHRQNIVHMDLKPENLLVGYKQRIKIADFGVSRLLDIDRKSSAVSKMEGTYHFWAPECLDGRKFSPFLADVWALGVCVYVFVYGSLPFDAPNIPDMFDTVMQSKLDFPSGVKMTSTFLDFCASMLRKDPAERPAVDALEVHPWLGKEWIENTARWPAPRDLVSVDDVDVANAVGDRALDINLIAKIKVKMERWRVRSAGNRRLRENVKSHVATLTNAEKKAYLRSRGVKCDFFMEKSELDDLAAKAFADEIGEKGAEAVLGRSDVGRASAGPQPPSPKGCCAVS